MKFVWVKKVIVDAAMEAPLFEREHRKEGQYIQRLQDELADTKGLLEAQARRQSDLEFVNEDLEHRLEQEAREKHQLEAHIARQDSRMQEERDKMQHEGLAWQKKLADEIRRREMIEERLRRAEKELYRMHQKKYDIERDIRQQESEKRAQEAHIVRDIVEESRKKQHNINPRYIQPTAIRSRQAYQAMLDFFGY